MSNGVADTAEDLARTLADFLHDIGDIDPARVLLARFGRATVADVVEIEERTDRLFELVDGALVEKCVRFRESIISKALCYRISSFVSRKKMGVVTEADGMIELLPNLVRMPDVALHYSWKRFPKGMPTDPCPRLCPDVAIEFVCTCQREGELRRKRQEYFESGVKALWLIDESQTTVTVYNRVDRARTFGRGEVVSTGKVLPGFSVELDALFGIRKRRQKA